MTDSEDGRQRPAHNASSSQQTSRAAAFDVEANRITPADEASLLPDALCRAAATVLPVDSTAISVYLGGDVAVPMGSSDAGAARAEQLQFTLGEGPCYQCYRIKSHVLLPDIDRADSSSWPIYARELTRHTPYRAVFAFPLSPLGAPVGSISLYRRSAGSSVELEDSRLVADRIATRLLDAGMFTNHADEGHDPWLDGVAAARRRQVWRAQGITMQTNKVNPSAALALLRGYAYTIDRLLDDVAEDIVEGRLAAPVIKTAR